MEEERRTLSYRLGMAHEALYLSSRTLLPAELYEALECALAAARVHLLEPEIARALDGSRSLEEDA